MKALFVLLFSIFSFSISTAQTATYSQVFGSTASSTNTGTTANTTFFSSIIPTSGANSGGTHRLVATHTAPTGSNFGLVTNSNSTAPSTNSSNPYFTSFGSGSRFYMRGRGDGNSDRATKFSVYNFGGATGSFAMTFDFYIDAANYTSPDVQNQDGTLLLIIGNEGTNNTVFSEAAQTRDNFDKSSVFIALRLTISNGSITSYRFWNNNRSGGADWDNSTNFSTALALNTTHRMVIVANNTSNSSNYSLNQVSHTVDSRTFDFFINNNLITNNNSTLGALSSGSALNGFSFNLGYNNNAQNLTLLLDNLTYTVNANNAAALPVTLSSFTAKPTIDNKVALAWVTSSESVNKGFSIERQEAGSGKFQSLGFVASKAEGGNSQSTLVYNFKDMTAKNGTNMYRLVQEDLDGKKTYSEVRVVKLNEQSVSMVFPNPSNGAITISRTADGKMMNIQVLDQSGRVISQVNNITDANYRMNLPQSGIYSIKMTYPETGEQSIQRVVVQK